MRKNQKHSEETIKKIKYKSISKPVVQMTPSGRLIDVFYSIREAEQVTGVFRYNIRRSCNRTGGILLANGYLWNYLDDVPDINRLIKESGN